MSKKRKGGPVPAYRKKEIIEELKGIIESGAILGVTDSHLAEKYEVSRATIVKYMNEIYESIPPEDINHLRIKIETMFKKLFREAQRLINNAHTDKDKKEAMEFLMKCIREFTEFLERFGLKQKAPDLHYVKGDVDNNINIQVFSTGEEKE